jgi:SAM-dependent methyltransferase
MKAPSFPLPELEKHSLADRLASMTKRIELRRTYLNAKIDKVLRNEVTNKNVGGEELRIWLEQFTKTGEGCDICCGNFLIGENTTGIDSAYDVMGNNYNFRGDDLSTFEAGRMDYIVCNYFDCFESPLKALNEWHRALKVGGKVAFACANSECYPEDGSMLNGKRRFLYTAGTIHQFMMKVFGNCTVKEHRTALLVSAVK